MGFETLPWSKKMLDGYKGRRSTLQPGRGRVADGSPQANYEARIASGQALSADEILSAKKYAASIGTTFDAGKGYGAPGAYKAKLGGGEGRFGSTFNQVKTSENIPASVRRIMNQGGPKTDREAKRLANFQGSTMGKKIYGGGSKTSASTARESGSTIRESGQERSGVGLASGVGGSNASAYRAKIGDAWANKFAQDEKRAAAVAAGGDRLNRYRAKIGVPQKSVKGGPRPAKKAGDLPEFFYAEGNADGSVSGYRGESARVAEARGRDEQGSRSKRPQLAGTSAIDSAGRPKKFKPRI